MSPRRIIFAAAAGFAVPFAIALFVRALCLVAGFPYADDAKLIAVLLGGAGVLPGVALGGAILEESSTR